MGHAVSENLIVIYCFSANDGPQKEGRLTKDASGLH